MRNRPQQSAENFYGVRVEFSKVGCGQGTGPTTGYDCNRTPRAQTPNALGLHLLQQPEGNSTEQTPPVPATKLLGDLSSPQQLLTPSLPSRPEGHRFWRAHSAKSSQESTVSLLASTPLPVSPILPGRAGEVRHGPSSSQPEPRVDEASRDHHRVHQGLLLSPGMALLLQHTEPPRDPRQLQGK